MYFHRKNVCRMWMYREIHVLIRIPKLIKLLFLFLTDNPCLSHYYVTLSEPTRAAGYLTPKGHAKCDRKDLDAEEGWYRFSGSAGSRMAKRCVPVRRCGTNAPGWLDGSHPYEYEGVVNRTVCFNWKNDCCHWKSEVKVRNCGSFYLYYLKRDPWGGCSYRYCGNGKGNGNGNEFI